MRLGGRPFFLGCGLGLVVGCLLPFLVGLAAITVFRKPLTPLLVSQTAQRLPLPPVTAGLQAEYDWQLVDLGGQLLDMESLRGHTVFLNFWRDTCIPCLAEVPALNALHAELGDEIAFVTVFVGKDGEAPFAVQREEVTFPVYEAVGGGHGEFPEDWPAVFKFTATPATYVVAPSGEIVFKHFGGARWDDPSAVEFLRSVAAR